MADVKTILEKFVDAEKLDSAIEELSQELPKNYIPKSRFNEVNEELKIVRATLEENKKAVETLTQKASSVEEYEKKLAELTQLNSDIEAKSQQQIASITKKSQLKELLLMNNAHHDALELLVEKYADVAEVEGDKLKDPQGLLSQIKTERAGLFIQSTTESVDKGANKESQPTDDSERLRKLYGLK